MKRFLTVLLLGAFVMGPTVSLYAADAKDGGVFRQVFLVGKLTKLLEDKALGTVFNLTPKKGRVTRLLTKHLKRLRKMKEGKRAEEPAGGAKELNLEDFVGQDVKIVLIHHGHLHYRRGARVIYVGKLISITPKEKAKAAGEAGGASSGSSSGKKTGGEDSSGTDKEAPGD